MQMTSELSNAINAYLEGNKDSFSEIYNHSHKYLYTCIIHIVKDNETALDILQETYLEISKNLVQLEDKDRFLNWASTIANRKCFAHLKKQKDVFFVGDYNGEDEDGFLEQIPVHEEFIPESVLQSKEKQRLIKEIINDLTEIQRLCVIAFYYNEQKQGEIAEELGIPVNTVKSHLNRAKDKIKEAVIELDEKKGTRLYSIAPFMALYFAMETEACEAIPLYFAVDNIELADANDAVNGVAQSGETMVKEVAKKVGLALKTKVIIGSVASGLAIICAVIGNNVIKDRESTDQFVEQTIVDEQEVLENETLEGVETVEDVEEFMKDEEVSEKEETTDETGEEEKVEVKYIGEGIKELGISGYEMYGGAHANVIPVKKNGLWGAINYQGEQIVPCEYSVYYAAANEKGYFILSDGENNYLFNSIGEIIYAGTEDLVASGNMYAKTMKYGDDIVQGGVEYYSYDGELILNTEVNDWMAIWANGFYDGIATLYETKFLSEDKQSFEYRTGSLHEDGNITWDENVIYSSVNLSPNGAFLPGVPINTKNHGYTVFKNIFNEAGHMQLYNDNNELVSVWNLYYVNEADNGFYVGGSYNESNYLKSYFHDGDFYYNYGSKMVWRVGEKDVLVDIALAPGMTWETMTTDIIVTTYSYIGMNDEKYWLVEKGEQWGYIDHDGNEIKMYDDATDFFKGRALVVEDGIAYMIDDNLNVIQELGEADGTSNLSEMFCIENGEEKRFIIVE